jgi:hypothetical protein
VTGTERGARTERDRADESTELFEIHALSHNRAEQGTGRARLQSSDWPTDAPMRFGRCGVTAVLTRAATATTETLARQRAGTG